MWARRIRENVNTRVRNVLGIEELWPRCILFSGVRSGCSLERGNVRKQRCVGKNTRQTTSQNNGRKKDKKSEYKRCISIWNGTLLITKEIEIKIPFSSIRLAKAYRLIITNVGKWVSLHTLNKTIYNLIIFFS